MRFASLAAFVLGTVVLAVLPVYTPPIVLQYDEVPLFLLGLGAAAAVGVSLVLATGRVVGIRLTPACALAGATLHTFAYAIPRYGIPDGWQVAVLLVLWTSLYTGAPAAIGAILAAAALALLRRFRR